MSHDPAHYSEGRSVERQMAGDDRSVGEIFSDLTENLSTLLRQEVALAKAELRQSAVQAGRGAGMLVAAVMAVMLMLVFLSLALWWAVAHLFDAVDPWFGVSAVIVGVIWAVIAGVLAGVGRKSLGNVEGAPRTARTVSQIPNALKGEEAQNR